jgi:uncharacterized repeat protein (TIGR03803 family)
LGLAGAAEAQTGFTVLHSFAGGAADGSFPSARLVQADDGNFYGTTPSGGSGNMGTIYRMTPSGAVTILHAFAGPEGLDPLAPLIVGPDGNFYGTTTLGGPGLFNGNGVVFRITPTGAYTVLHFFNGSDGRFPQAGLAAGKDGNFYGTTSSGGASDAGTVFRITPSGTLTTLHSFSGPDGSMPNGPLVMPPDVNFYGTTSGGGAANGGTVFRISMSGAFTLLHSFTFTPPDGNTPRGGLALGSDLNLYGTLEFGGANSSGAAYRISMAGQYTLLHSFSFPEGANPLAGLLLANDGKFYGTNSGGGANNNGTIFSMTPSGVVNVVRSLNAATDGGFPNAELIQANDGRIYGISSDGGAFSQGTVWRFSLQGPATVTARASVNTPYFTQEDAVLTTSAPITALTLTITIKVTPGLVFSGMYQNVSGQITETHTSSPSTITYRWVLQPGATIPVGTWTFAAQMGSSGVTHSQSGDTFQLSYTSGGQVFTQSGTF